MVRKYHGKYSYYMRGERRLCMTKRFMKQATFLKMNLPIYFSTKSQKDIFTSCHKKTSFCKFRNEIKLFFIFNSVWKFFYWMTPAQSRSHSLFIARFIKRAVLLAFATDGESEARSERKLKKTGLGIHTHSNTQTDVYRWNMLRRRTHHASMLLC